MSDYVSGLSEEDQGDELRCLITCQDCQTRIKVMSSDGLGFRFRV
jgi:hypothetical protein